MAYRSKRPPLHSRRNDVDLYSELIKRDQYQNDAFRSMSNRNDERRNSRASSYDLNSPDDSHDPTTNSVSYPFHVYDATLPRALLDQFQTYFCKLCSFQISRRFIGKLHYDSKGHLKNVRNYLIRYSEETGAPLHPVAELGIKKPKAKCASPTDEAPVYYSRCSICKVDLNSEGQATAHFQGKNHLKKAGTASAGAEVSTSVAPVEPTVELVTEECNLEALGLPTAFASKQVKVKEAYRCDLCNVTATSEEHMNDHVSGTKHRKLEEAAEKAKSDVNGTGLPKKSPKEVVQGEFHCEVCDIYATSEENMRDHLNGQKHRKKAGAGKSNLPDINNDVYSCRACNFSTNSLIQFDLHKQNKAHKLLLSNISESHVVGGRMHDHFQQYSDYDNYFNDPQTSYNEMRGSKRKISYGEESASTSALFNDPQDFKRKFSYEEPSNLKSIRCGVCDITVTSAEQLDIHCEGFKHLSRLKQQDSGDKNQGEESEYRESYGNESPDPNLFCHRCDIACQSEEQYINHMNGKKHWSNIKKNSYF